VPVTAKIRKGYSADNVNAVEVALACESAGAAAITVHGRTRDQMYSPPADWDIIRQVKCALKIPVIGNGEVTSAVEAARLYEHTDCDLIMVGRGALGAPWIFAQINTYLEHGRLLPDPPVSKRMEVLLRQVTLAVELKGEKTALLEARKHASWAMRGLKGAASFRSRAGQISTLDDLKALCFDVCRENDNPDCDAK
ncbi:MAG: tRNA-dihydrouridine synthase, partial [Oscillospiraceae bacterium]|nr:tRNA-dihydrouridine synthase [Oscillospiraceae bacterium]